MCTIGERLGRGPSTIRRELARSATNALGYLPYIAVNSGEGAGAASNMKRDFIPRTRALDSSFVRRLQVEPVLRHTMSNGVASAQSRSARCIPTETKNAPATKGENPSHDLNRNGPERINYPGLSEDVTRASGHRYSWKHQRQGR